MPAIVKKAIPGSNFFSEKEILKNVTAQGTLSFIFSKNSFFFF